MAELEKNYTDAQYTKLPIWAKNEIARLEAKTIYLQNKLEKITNNEVSNTCYDVTSDTVCYLPDNQTVKFFLGKDVINVRVNKVFNILEIHGQSFDKTFCVLPKVTNSIAIEYK